MSYFSSLHVVFHQFFVCFVPNKVDLLDPLSFVPKASVVEAVNGIIYLLTAVGLNPMAVVRYTFTHKQYIEQQLTQTIHRTTQLTNWEGYRPCPVFASYTLAYALRLRKKHRKPQSG
jgi:hypothetical protein